MPFTPPQCDKCHKATKWADAALYIDDGKASEFALAMARETVRTHERPMEGGITLGDPAAMEAMFKHNETVAAVARWLHADCAGEEHEGDYRIDGHRISTPERALAWTLQLEEKTWFHIEWWALTLERLGADRSLG